MWPLMEKEIRENFRVLVGSFVVFYLLMEVGAYRRGWTLLLSRVVYGDAQSWRVLEYERFMPSMFTRGPLPVLEWTTACTLVALTMAAFQVLGEKVRGTGPLLAHLPTPPRCIALAKLLAGLSMYGCLVLSMCALLGARLSTPGTLPAPFCLRALVILAWPSLAGAVLYLWALAALMRPARWYATKWLLLAPSIPVFASAFFLISITNVYQYHFGQTYPSGPSDTLVVGISLLVYVSAASLSLWAILRCQEATEC